MPQIRLPELSGLIQSASDVSLSPRTSSTDALAFFDLSGSTSLKLTKGHAAGADAASRFVYVASEITKQAGGDVVKELGDGLLCRFSDPIGACRSALSLQYVCRELAIGFSAGLTLGRIDIYTNLSGQDDVVGAAVDRCARIQSIAYPGQLLIDEPLYEVVRSHLTPYADAAVGERFVTDAKGIGRITVRELAASTNNFFNRIVTPFSVSAGGRLSIAEKTRFVNRAEQEVIEIGTGLTSFAKYFTGQKPEEFQDHIGNLLRRGVTVKCYAVNPEYDPARLYLQDAADQNYVQDLMRARELILEERKAFLSQGFPGALEYYRYSSVPEFHCICVDRDDELNGRILFSPYMPGVSRAAAPVYQVSAVTNRELFNKYIASVRAIGAKAEEIAV
jgi:class 3 adenylate cyclase